MLEQTGIYSERTQQYYQNGPSFSDLPEGFEVVLATECFPTVIGFHENKLVELHIDKAPRHITLKQSLKLSEEMWAFSFETGFAPPIGDDDGHPRWLKMLRHALP